MTKIAIVSDEGKLRFVEVAEVHDVISVEGVRYEATGTIRHQGQRVSTFRPSCFAVRKGNCSRCGGTGRFGNYGICWSCEGSGNSLIRGSR